MENLRITAKGIKREARGLLANNWSRALGGLCIYLMVLVLFVQVTQLVTALLGEYGTGWTSSKKLNGFADYFEFYTSGDMGVNMLIMLALAAFFFLLSAPLSLGITYWYRKLSLLEGLQVGQIFHFYQSNQKFIDAVIFQALHTAFRLGFALISFLPSVVCFAFSYGAGKSAEGGSGSTLLLILGIGLAVAGLFVYGALSLNFFFAKYLYCGEYGYGPMDCLRYSAMYMKRHIGHVLGVIVSFAGWFASCIFILPLAYVVPFYNASMAACAQDIIDEHMGETLERLKKR